MYRRDFVISTFACVVELSMASRVLAQKKTVEPDLAALAEGKGLKVFNRSLSVINDGARKGVRLSESPGDGVAYLEGVEFTNGAIEFDVRGKDVQQQSFVGVAFHGLDEKTYDAIYFRPFNFKTEDQARRIRAVQYISHPTCTWQKLRTEQPGKYEKPVSPAPDPNDWFHARIVVASPKVSVFVNDAKEPSLVVEQLSDRKRGLVGLWVGNTSGGDFANFKIIPV
jgi:3-keto-disaccharide hydrolase